MLKRNMNLGVGPDDGDFARLKAAYDRLQIGAEQVQVSAGTSTLDERAREELFQELKQGPSVYGVTMLRHDFIVEADGQHYVTDQYGQKMGVNITMDVLKKTVDILGRRKEKSHPLDFGYKYLCPVYAIKGIDDVNPHDPSFPPDRDRLLTIVLRLGDMAPDHILLYANKRVIPGTEDDTLEAARKFLDTKPWETISN